jgi:hypothetical protein
MGDVDGCPSSMVYCLADKNPDKGDEATERFREILNAWEVLSDPQVRTPVASTHDVARDALLNTLEHSISCHNRFILLQVLD